MTHLENSYTNLPEYFYSREKADVPPQPEWIRGNDELATQLGFDLDWFHSPEGLALFSGQEVPEGIEPVALAYAGHQFGGWVPQLGDGRALLLGEAKTEEGERFDIQLKGSGRTAFSRGGDGKAPLGPVLREYVVSEAMAAMGVPTTRALVAVATGEPVYREEHLPGAVITRVAASHLRIGTFQFAIARGGTDGARALADYAIERHDSDLAEEPDRYLIFLERVLERQADLIAQWMSLGFVHGVMNTDNMTISGETIDYGPCAFIDDFRPDAVFSSIDREGRYAWDHQPDIGMWNLSRLAETLLPMIDEEESKSIVLAKAVLEKYPERFRSVFYSRMKAKLGLGGEEKLAEKLVDNTLELLAAESVDFTRFFRSLTQFASGSNSEAELEGEFANPEIAREWMTAWRTISAGAPDLEAMKLANPVVIPRNHRIEEAIQAAVKNGDLSPFHQLVDRVTKPFSESAGKTDFEAPPKPEEIVTSTFCGT